MSPQDPMFVSVREFEAWTKTLDRSLEDFCDRMGRLEVGLNTIADKATAAGHASSFQTGLLSFLGGFLPAVAVLIFWAIDKWGGK